MKKNTGLTTVVVPAVLGLALILLPNTTVNLIAKLVGIALILTGGVGVYESVTGRSRSTESGVKLVGSIVALVIGVWMMFHTRRITRMVPIVAGLAVMAVSAYRIWQTLKRGGSKNELGALAVAFVAGLVIAMNPFRTIRLFAVAAGVVLLYTAVTGLIGKR